ncbi:MAG: bifunctional diaminohydroxyphosphoribosylaminopyrimidine deaminase/5-amino-6-(5-phosphoribosylamino)uracil reductase RibD [Acidobacteria bacterium]|nr:bifunctional diaminohydroxyphosphoribosylaminopyrimidine deaminase/5-amino-6-(5-phosphoribosylamino)uracil reductase RibD [Acidobacteriota bacterium]
MKAGESGPGSRRRDEVWMDRALALARRGQGAVAPNPMVGAVLVRHNRVVAEGYHRIYGGDHAEVSALRRAGTAARGATLYTNLEPCAHQGKTPPCAMALREAGIRRAVVAARDADPRVQGGGLRLLRRAGVQVELGLKEQAARALNEPYLTRMGQGRPLVILKAGASLDGRIAGRGGHSRWITSVESRRRGRAWRERVDAILVGGRTALADDPFLTVRKSGRPARRQPLRVVLVGRKGPRPGARLFHDATGAVLIYAITGFGERRRVLERAGAEVVEVPGEKQRPDVSHVLTDLGRRGVASVLVEGGGEVAWSFLRKGLVDHLIWYISPLIIGGGGVPVVGGPGVPRPAAGIPLQDLRLKRIGPDLEIWARPAGKLPPHRLEP